MGGLPRRAGARVMDGVTLVSVAHAPGTGRADARAAIRAALCASVAQALGETDVRVDGVPGAAPRLLVNGELSPVGLAISHTDSRSFAVWHPTARLGLDVMAVADVPDWRAVARDYLGPEALTRLDAESAATRASAFAREWTTREASLKCLGLGLAEWTELPCPLVLNELALASGFAGAIARKG
jgi:4'-phosphopantetheinyl transferase